MPTAPLTTAALMAQMPHILAAPRDGAPITSLCLRPGVGQRQEVEQLELTQARGIPGERWETAPWLRLPDGSPDPRIQVSILPARVMTAVWRDRKATPHPGDPIVADLECSYGNLPVGSRLQIGSAVVEVSDVFNDGCVKWKARYGAAAKDWLVAREHVHLRLRGLLCRVVQDGTLTLSDKIFKL